MRSGRADGGPPRVFPGGWWACCRGRLDGFSGCRSPSPPSTTGAAFPPTPHERTTAVPLDREVDAWLASLRAQGYSARQLEYRAGVLGRWAAGVSMQSAIPRAVVAFLAWREAQRVQRLGSP